MEISGLKGNCFHNFCISNQYVPKARKQTLLNILVSSIHLCSYVVIYVNTFDFVIRHIIPTTILCRTVCYPSHWPGNIVWSHPDTCIADMTSKVPRVGNHKGSQFTYDMNWVRWPHFLTKISMRSSFFLELEDEVEHCTNILWGFQKSWCQHPKTMNTRPFFGWLSIIFSSNFAFVCRYVFLWSTNCILKAQN